LESEIFELIENLRNSNYKDLEDLESETDSENDSNSQGSDSIEFSELSLDYRKKRYIKSKTEQEEVKSLQVKRNLGMSKSIRLKELDYSNVNSKKAISYIYLELEYRSKILY